MTPRPPRSCLSLLAALAASLCACALTGEEARIERPLAYRSDGLLQVATLYMPPPGPVPVASSAVASVAPVARPVPGRRPAVVLLHGGFFGEDEGTAEIGLQIARQGVLVAAPAYRGEKRHFDGERSEGKIEFCAGEVDDALALVAELRRRPDVDPDRIGLLGFSHGGCIALRSAARDPRIRAVVTFSAPADAAATYYNLRDRPLGLFGFHGWLASRMQAWVGGEPSRWQGRWLLRSPLYEVRGLTMPLLLVHGLKDDLVPTEQVCWLGAALRRVGRPFVERQFDEAGKPVAAPPFCPTDGASAGAPPATGATPPATDGASGAESDAESGAPPSDNPAPVEIWLYAGQGHGFSKETREVAYRQAIEFLLAQLRR